MRKKTTDRDSDPRQDISDVLERIAQHLDADGLQLVSERFGLSSFERDTLLLCAGVEVQPDVADLLATLHGSRARPYPTFGLLLAVHPESHWSAVTSDAPLRYWRMIGIDTAGSAIHSAMRIDERILNALMGVHQLDERLQSFVPGMPSPEESDGDLQVAERLVAIWTKQVPDTAKTIIQLCGGDSASRAATANMVARLLGRELRFLDAGSLPSDGRDLVELARLCDREFLLTGTILSTVYSEEIESGREYASLHRFLSILWAPCMLIARDRLVLDGFDSLSFDIARPGRTKQRSLWQWYLNEAAVSDEDLDRVVAQYDLHASTIRRICRAYTALHGTATQSPDISDERRAYEENAKGAGESSLWDLCRRQLRPKLHALAQHIEPVAQWNDLVLPEEQRHTIEEIALHIRRRIRVYEDWGFAAKGRRGLGISALFSGASGTGKTMAAEVLARELEMDLYRIDLSQVVSKYIGETEKNLRRVFDAAESGGAILLFDEADALFGKRSEVRDSHDRYANVEISYLLQRMEDFRGLAVLATNKREAIDEAFLRRIRFLVSFPFPDLEQRAEIWRRVFPEETPRNGLDVRKLAQLRMAGGNIRNIALHAAFLAAEDNTSVAMRHVLTATRRETAKLHRPLSAAETEGW